MVSRSGRSLTVYPRPFAWPFPAAARLINSAQRLTTKAQKQKGRERNQPWRKGNRDDDCAGQKPDAVETGQGQYIDARLALEPERIADRQHVICAQDQKEVERYQQGQQYRQQERSGAQGDT